MRYKIINKKNRIGTIQVILFPKQLIDLCKVVSKELGIKVQAINTNFDILQKLIDENMIDYIGETSVFLEVRRNEFIINKVKDNIINESYVLPKNDYLEDYINKLHKLQTNLYYYGNEEFIYKNINKIILNPVKRSIKVHEGLSQDISKYINTIGIVI